METLDSVLEQLGLTGPFTQAEYVRVMETRFGRNGARFMDAVDTNDGAPGGFSRLWFLKNRDAEMSAYVTAHQCSGLYRTFLSWLQAHPLDQGRDVLELGCDSGLLLMAIARLFPSSRCIGVDREPRAIQAARRLARQHGIPNVSFDVLDIAQDGARQSPPGPVPVVVAPWVLHEVLPVSLRGHLGEAPSLDALPEEEARGARNIRRLISDHGRLVTVNRFPGGPRQAAVLTAILRQVGFEETGSDVITVVDGLMGGTESFPVVEYTAVARLP